MTLISIPAYAQVINQPQSSVTPESLTGVTESEIINNQAAPQILTPQELQEHNKLAVDNLNPETKDLRSKIMSVLGSGQETVISDIKISREIVNNIYENRNFTPVFFTDFKPNANYEKAIKFISLSSENGLNGSYFSPENVTSLVKEGENNRDAIARADILLVHLVSEMLLEIGNGHKIPDDLQLQTYFKRPVRVVNVAAVFKEFLETGSVESLIEKYSPKHQQFAYLKKALKIAIENSGDRESSPKIEFTENVLPGAKSKTVEQIRERIGSKRSYNRNIPNDVYDASLLERVKLYQKKFRMEEDGTITKEFVDNLNSFNDEAIYRIKANMERYKWLPDDMPKNRIEVNLPEYKLYAYRNGVLDFEMSAIVGKDAHRTPIMNTKMYQFILNPYWNVPRDYSLRNMVPLLKQDPNYAKNQNFELLQMQNGQWQPISQSSVNWNHVTKENYNLLLRQRPGNLNVLGPIKFAIENPYDIYLHSTSEPWLFTNEKRGFSSGCIRVEDPVKLAKYVREIGGADITEARFKELYETYQSKDGRILPQQPDKNDRYVKLKTPIPTFTEYFSASADENGAATFAEDTYGLDFTMSKEMKL